MKWTALYIKLLDGTMKRIGNIQLSSSDEPRFETGAMSLYYEYTRYHDSPDLYSREPRPSGFCR